MISPGSRRTSASRSGPTNGWLGGATRARTLEAFGDSPPIAERFAEEARRIHYGEAPSRGIRGQATAQERTELVEEGIEVMQLPIPKGLDGPAH